MNAAGYHEAGDLESTTAEDWNRMIAVHVTGTVFPVDGGLTAI